MAEVIPFASPRSDTEGPHAQGTAHCLACKHEWEAVAPTGTTILECPSCGLMRGAWKHSFGAAIGDVVYTCNHCQAEEFFFRVRGGVVRINCVGCGINHSIEDVFPR